MQRQATPPKAPQQNLSRQQSAQQPATAGAQPKRSWMGPLAGLAAGLGLAALFSHLGLSEEFGSMIMIALLVFGAFALFRMLTRRQSATSGGNGLQYAGAASAGQPARFDQNTAAYAGTAAGDAGANPAIPADFDAQGFARQAKLNFIRLQAANDEGNLDDIREFTSPEIFAEIQLQLGERGVAPQRTDVVELNADVIEVTEEAQRYVVSVRFTGLLRENPDAAPEAFDEIWHLTKSVSGAGGWVVAGIQQVS
jgi:predicted lipid-binding transport protein (Tim44 family)